MGESLLWIIDSCTVRSDAPSYLYTSSHGRQVVCVYSGSPQVLQLRSCVAKEEAVPSVFSFWGVRNQLPCASAGREKTAEKKRWGA
jgi:hypothetical protein